MKLNTIFLRALLVPFTIASINETNTSVEGLKKHLEEKAVELSNLSERITKKEVLIDAMTSRGRNFYSLIYETSDDSDAEEFKDEIKKFQESFNKASFSKNSLKEFLLKKLTSTTKGTDEVERIKSWIIRYKIEYLLLKNLIESYEKCLRELLEVEIQLEVYEDDI